MKYFLIFALIIIAEKSFSQTHPQEPKLAIKAKDAYKHIGELVTVYDSLYSGKIVQDSLVVCQMGPETNTPRLTAIFISTYEKHWDHRFFNVLQRHKIWLTGIITGTKEAPVIVMHNTEGVYMGNINDAHGHTHEHK